MEQFITKERFKEIEGKSIIVGLTYLHEDDSISHRVQFSGIITGLDSEGLIITKNADKEEFRVPPFESAMQKAPEGEYTLKTTGEVVINPDYMMTWRMYLNEDEIK